VNARPEPSLDDQASTTRRAALTLGAVTGAAAMLGGCSVYGESSGTEDVAEAEPPNASTPPPTAANQDPAEDDPAEDDPAADDPAAEAPTKKEPAGKPALAKVSDIPVGGGKIFTAKKVVVTQPTAGTFAAFSTVCTHQGCPVSQIKGGTINCLCHGSKFAIADGSVTDGPASKPLAAKKITVDGDSLTLD
jgi:Rieske Fe-S protein